MMLWQIWHPRYGVVYDEVDQIKRAGAATTLEGSYYEEIIPLEARRTCGDQLGWSFIGIGETIEGDYEGCAWGVEPLLL